jgi:hypothetical protein
MAQGKPSEHFAVVVPDLAAEHPEASDGIARSQASSVARELRSVVRASAHLKWRGSSTGFLVAGSSLAPFPKMGSPTIPNGATSTLVPLTPLEICPNYQREQSPPKDGVNWCQAFTAIVGYRAAA